MPYLPISPLSAELPLSAPSGSSETLLGPIPNVSDGIPGIGGIGSVELPGVGVITSPPGGFTMPSLPSLSAPAPIVAPAPASTPTPGGGIAPVPEVTPFPGVTATPTPGATPTATGTPLPAPSAQVAPTPQATVAPQPTSTPVPGAGQLQQPAVGSPYSTQPITTDKIPPLVQTPFTPTTSGIPVKQTPLAETFGNYLKDAASNYNATQNQADSM